jgi:uncharacterized protein (UPF0248 family)
MKKKKVREILHEMVDSLENKYILYDLKKNIFPYVIKYRSKKTDKDDDDLTVNQIKRLDEMISRPDDQEALTLNEVKKSFVKWLPDEDTQLKREKKISKASKKKLKEKLHKILDDIKSKYLLTVLLDEIMPDALNKNNHE